MDIAEGLAIARTKEVFRAEHINVRPHSGVQANAITFLETLKPGFFNISS